MDRTHFDAPENVYFFKIRWKLLELLKETVFGPAKTEKKIFFRFFNNLLYINVPCHLIFKKMKK